VQLSVKRSLTVAPAVGVNGPNYVIQIVATAYNEDLLQRRPPKPDITEVISVSSFVRLR
jgi:hypothetical protein